MNRHIPTHNPTDELTAADLRAYRAGQLSGTALNRVERLLLENPFYADALDGLDALQHVGANLHTHTRDLHLVLQQRVQEAATPRRLMPLWIASAMACILLVLAVAVYFIYYVPAQKRANHPTDGIEPGTVLISPSALGTSAAVPPTSASANVPRK
jgi:hypothetical protein